MWAIALASAALVTGCIAPLPTGSGTDGDAAGLIDLDAPSDGGLAWLPRLPVAAVEPDAEPLPEEGPRFIVKSRGGDTGRSVQAIAPGSKTVAISQLALKVLVAPKGFDAKRLLDALKGDPTIAYAELDASATAFYVPNDSEYAKQWGLPKISAPTAWDSARSTESVRIAILDTGIDVDHPDLAKKIVVAKNFSSSKKVDDLYGHGTHVAGIAAAITGNKAGVAGVAISASLMNVKVLGDSGSGSYSSIIKGVVWAADNGAKVINMSLGGGSASQAMADAVKYAVGKGVTIVAAAGNSNTSAPSYPAYIPECIAVAATTTTDARASFSNYGTWVDVAAPGNGIYSTLPNHANRIGTRNYGSLSGTSMASPFVAGEAALLAAIPATASVRDRIEATCDPIAGTGSLWAKGRINLAKAVAAR
jgi:thermitase